MIWILVVAFFAVSGCGLSDSVKSVGGLLNGIDSTGGKLVRGIRDTVTNRKSQIQFDSLLAALGGGLVRGIRDTLTNDRSRRELDSLVSTIGGSIVGGMRDTLLGETSRVKIDSFLNHIGLNIENRLSRIRTDVLGPATIAKLLAMREELVGHRLKNEIDSIVASAVDTFSTHLKMGIQPQLKEDVVEVQRSASIVIWEVVAGVLVVAMVIIFVIYRTHLKLNKLLLHQIDQIPDQAHYDELTRRIQLGAIDQGVETTLRRILSKQGINPKSSSEHDARNKTLIQKLGTGQAKGNTGDR